LGVSQTEKRRNEEFWGFKQQVKYGITLEYLKEVDVTLRRPIIENSLTKIKS
jgi:hypothetical protein